MLNKGDVLEQKPISTIKKVLLETPIEKIDDFIKVYTEDTRKGVQKLVLRAAKEKEAYENEQGRVENMLMYERQLPQESIIGGIDEAGRGPLAGPVVAAVVILNPKDPILYIDDSKKLSAQKREYLYDEIISRAHAYGIGVVSEGEIDQINILQATYKAMRHAISQCNVEPDHLLNDAVIIPDVAIKQTKIIKGDSKSLSIAAASILAKVTRDRLMLAYDELYPEYGFKRNKGYGSAEHIKSIKQIGPCPIHRRTFIKNFINEE